MITDTNKPTYHGPAPFAIVLSEAAEKRKQKAEHEIEVKERRRQEIRDWAASLDDGPKYIDWPSFFPYLKEAISKGLFASEMADHISKETGRTVTKNRVLDAIAYYQLRKVDQTA